MTKNQSPKVYVGTWKKYNEGNLKGAWIDLSQCGTYDDFLNKCRETHKDEQEPEFMIQDTECMPDGLDIVDWLAENDFNDIKKEMDEAKNQDVNGSGCRIIIYSDKAIAVVGETKQLKDEFKKLGGKFNPRLSCGAGWIFSKKAADNVSALLNGSLILQKGAEKPKDEVSEYIDALKEYAELRSDKEYVLKEYAAAVKVHGGYYLIDKPRIKNRFCFHDEGPDYEFYCKITSDEERMKKYFIRENLDQVSEWSEECRYTTMPIFFTSYGEYYKGLVGLMQCYMCEADRHRPEDRATADELEQVNKAIRFVRAGFEKRLNTYLKRYGVSKIHTWTYWADA